MAGTVEDRDLRMDLSALAPGVFYPEGAAAAATSWSTPPSRLKQHRGQQLVLLAPAARTLSAAGASGRPTASSSRSRAARFITHMKKLADVRDARWPTSSRPASLALGEKLGPVLWQLPPTLGFDADAARATFFGLLPRTTGEAARARARATTSGSRGERGSSPDGSRPIRHALEVRHDSFVDARVPRRCSATTTSRLVVADTAGQVAADPTR